MNMQTPRLSANDVFDILEAKTIKLSQAGYYAMYSSWLGGIVTDVGLMNLPIDDHMVHRGDGVFEALKLVNGGIYLLEEHLERLFLGAAKLNLNQNYNKDQLRQIILQTAQAGLDFFVQKNPGAQIQDFSAIVRLFLSRGPGSFGTNPYETIGNQFYCVITELKAVSPEKYKTGVSIGKSHLAVKSSWFPTIKSCNYLPNVLMKKEAVDRHLDFTVTFTDEGFMAESSTENIFLLDRSLQLIHPRCDYILKGTMMTRIFELAKYHNIVPVAEPADITESNLIGAQGVFMSGTTFDLLPVNNYEGMKIPSATVYEKLFKLLKEDQRAGSPKMTALK